MKAEQLVRRQREFFDSGKTFDISYRIQALDRLEGAIRKYENELYTALKEDLGKSREEAYMCEVGLALSEIGYIKRHVRMWSKDRRVRTPLAQFHAKSFTVQEPYGVTLVMSPWNYPLLLTMEPLAGALAAGNCCVVKPSAYAPAMSGVLAEMLGRIFPEEYVAVAEGGRQENQDLLNQKFDYIFFTGGVSAGKMVMEKAAANLTPVTLELGGKSPCIIDGTANLQMAARRLVFGKYLNCGQTCVAPDYVLAEACIKDRLLEELKKEIVRQFGEHPMENPSYGKMVNQKHFDRVRMLMEADRDRLIWGGECDAAMLRIAPSVLADVDEKSPVMCEEIFGPVLPVLSVRDMKEALTFVKKRPKPLALYVFTSDKETERRFLREVSFGGGCVNDTIIHLATPHMGFGGVGESGMGSYHGRKSFETFSHEKGIVKKYTWLDMPIRYQPYTRIKEKMTKIFLK